MRNADSSFDGEVSGWVEDFTTRRPLFLYYNQLNVFFIKLPAVLVAALICCYNKNKSSSSSYRPQF
jgi:hypothetical protein